MAGSSGISGVLTNKFKCLPDQTTLEEAIRALEDNDYGVITGDGGKVEGLVTKDVLTGLLEDAARAKTSLWDLRGKWPPMVMASMQGQMGIDGDYPPIRVDAPTLRAGAKGVVFVRDNKVERIMAFKGASLPEDLKGAVLISPPISSFSLSVDILHHGDLASRGLGGSIGVGNIIYCKKCGRAAPYYYYDSDAPPRCPNGHVVKL